MYLHGLSVNCLAVKWTGCQMSHGQLSGGQTSRGQMSWTVDPIDACTNSWVEISVWFSPHIILAISRTTAGCCTYGLVIRPCSRYLNYFRTQF